jgi:hypothetical protein
VQYLKVKDAEEFVRDADSSAILNTDNDSLRAYKARKKKEAQLDSMMREHEELKRDINEIKELLRSLAGHNK